MRNTNFIWGVAISLLFSNVMFGQASTESDEKTRTDTEVELYSTILSKAFERVELQDGQMDKIQAVIDRRVPEMIGARKALEKILATEQQSKFAAAKRQAIAAGYDEERAEAYAFKKLNLDKAEIEKYKSAKASVFNANNSMNEDIKALLTPEQRESLPMYKTKKAAPKNNRMFSYNIKLPKMKSEEDGKKVQSIVNGIKGAANFESKLEDNMVSVKFPAGTNVRSEFAKLAKENEVLGDFVVELDPKKSMVRPGGSPSKMVKPTPGGTTAGSESKGSGKK